MNRLIRINVAIQNRLDNVLLYCETTPKRMDDIADHIAMSSSSTIEYIRHLREHKQMHIAQWSATSKGRLSVPYYLAGDFPDTPKPLPKVARISAERTKKVPMFENKLLPVTRFVPTKQSWLSPLECV